MKVVLAAIDATAAARPVLETALRVGHGLSAQVRAVHAGTCAPRVAADLGVPVTVVDRAPLEVIVAGVEDPDVELVVLALHGLPGRHEAGHTARAVATAVTKPVVVVPPEAPVRRSLRRILLPLDGSSEVSAGVRSLITEYVAAGADVVAVHVFERQTVPRFLDGEPDAAMWRDEFLRQHCAELGVRLETRAGPIAHALLEVAREQDVDVVALGWHQDLTLERHRVVREVLESAWRPVALVPLRDAS